MAPKPLSLDMKCGSDSLSVQAEGPSGVQAIVGALMKPAAAGQFHDGLTTTEFGRQIEQQFQQLDRIGSDTLHRE
jgi:hypothetical protein